MSAEIFTQHAKSYLNRMQHEVMDIMTCFPSEDSDQTVCSYNLTSLCYLLIDTLNNNRAPQEDSDQPACMCRLICVFNECTTCHKLHFLTLKLETNTALEKKTKQILHVKNMKLACSLVQSGWSLHCSSSQYCKTYLANSSKSNSTQIWRPVWNLAIYKRSW